MRKYIMSGSLIEKIGKIHRVFRRKKLIQETVRFGDKEISKAELEENIQTFRQILENIEKNSTARYAFDIYAVAFQEKRITALGNILPKPTEFVELSRDKTREAIWYIHRIFCMESDLQFFYLTIFSHGNSLLPKCP